MTIQPTVTNQWVRPESTVKPTRRQAAAPGGLQEPAAANPPRGKAHVQQGLKHIVREVRHAVKAELRELAAAGDADPGYVAAVRNSVHEFRGDLQDTFLAAAEGPTVDRDVVSQLLGTALADMTARLASLREARDDRDEPYRNPDGSPSDPGLVVDRLA